MMTIDEFLTYVDDSIRICDSNDLIITKLDTNDYQIECNKFDPYDGIFYKIKFYEHCYIIYDNAYADNYAVTDTNKLIDYETFIDAYNHTADEILQAINTYLNYKLY